MVYKNFRIVCTARAVLLAVSVFGFFIILFRTDLYAALFILGGMIIYQVYSLIRYIEKTNRDLERLVMSIKYSDFSQTFKDDKRGASFASLRRTLQEVMDAFRRARAEKEEHFRYLQTVVQHVGIGLIAFRPNGEVELINAAAKKLLGVARVNNIRSLKSISGPLADKLFNLKPKERALIKITDNDEQMHLALFATEFKLRGEFYKLVSLQNIHRELEETEMEAWQKLIRVITHEIMNSVTPITSLAGTIHDLLQEGYKDWIPEGSEQDETLKDIQDGLDTIKRRSQGLLHFVDAYRNMTVVSQPEFKIVPVEELFSRVEKLMQAHIKEKKIAFTVSIEPSNLELLADPELIEQVLINLLLNALQSAEKQSQPVIQLRAFVDHNGRNAIQVVDNGPGIKPDDLEKIFIPFYSTKETGSGIGLSLSRQIMRLHRGGINVHSKPGVETVFTLRF